MGASDAASRTDDGQRGSCCDAHGKGRVQDADNQDAAILGSMVERARFWVGNA